jgi:tight adherence protein B
MNQLIIIGLCTAITIALFVYGLVVAFGRRRAAVAERLETYSTIEEEAAVAADVEMGQLSSLQRILHVVLGRGYMQKLEESLAQADIPMRPSEYFLARLALAGLGFIVGLYGLGYLHSGVFFAIAGFLVPAMVVRVHQNRRRNKFVSQLADALMLLTNSLRSGYGFLKGLELIAKEMHDPIAKELNRMLREVNLGSTVDQAMLNLGKRINSQDLDIVISAYLIQKEVGGNLTEIMEKVAETIRERLRIQGDIRVLTAQGRLSGLIVGLLPLVLFFFFVLRTPDYFKPMFEPPMIGLMGGLHAPLGVLLLLGAFAWQIMGGYFIYRIINIRV